MPATLIAIEIDVMPSILEGILANTCAECMTRRGRRVSHLDVCSGYALVVWAWCSDTSSIALIASVLSESA